MEEKNNQKKKILILVLVLGLVLLTIGGTYAFFTYTRQGQQENVLTTGRLYFIYDELSDIPDNSIAIQNAYPVSDEKGKLQEGQGMFEFQIRATTSGSAINYEVYLTKDDSSTLDEKTVNTYLSSVPTKGGDIETESAITNEWTKKDINQYNKLWISQEPPVKEAGNGKTLLQDTVPDNQTDYTKTYRYRMWVNENASGTDEEGNWIYGGKSFTVRVNVYASNETLPPPIAPPNYIRSWAVYNDEYGAYGPIEEEVDFHTSELKDQITSIVFEKSSVAPLDPEQEWDVSEEQDGSIMAYLVPDTEAKRLSNKSLEISKTNTLINLGNQTNIKATKMADIPENPKKVIIQSRGDIYANPISAYMFSGDYEETFYYLQKIEFNNFNTSKVTNMSYMFYYCEQLSTITGIENWDTSSVTDMSAMFSYCEQLSTITGIENWDTSSVTDMSEMFISCSQLASIDISGWIIQEETDVDEMFCNCLADENEGIIGLDKNQERQSEMTIFRGDV